MSTDFTHIYKGKQERFYNKPCIATSAYGSCTDVIFEDGQVARGVYTAHLEEIKKLFKPTHRYIGTSLVNNSRDCIITEDTDPDGFITIQFEDGSELYPHKRNVVTLKEAEDPERLPVLTVMPEDRNYKPEHYHSGGIDPWKFIEANLNPQQAVGFHLGNVLKYVARHEKKNGLEDLKKAQDSLKEAIRLYEAGTIRTDK